MACCSWLNARLVPEQCFRSHSEVVGTFNRIQGALKKTDEQDQLFEHDSRIKEDFQHEHDPGVNKVNGASKAMECPCKQQTRSTSKHIFAYNFLNNDF